MLSSEEDYQYKYYDMDDTVEAALTCAREVLSR